MDKRVYLVIIWLIVGILVLALPAAAFAQALQPPTGLEQVIEESDDDILVIEPQLFFELPLAEGFSISFNFGFTIRIPRQLNLVTQRGYDLFLRIRSYVIPAD